MARLLTKSWILKSKPQGLPSEKDFECVEEELQDCPDDGVVTEAEYISVDPYIRYRIRFSEENAVVAGSQVVRVIKSKNKEFPIGIYLVGYPGWRTHCLLRKEDLNAQGDLRFTKIPDLGSYPKSTALGVLGMPGCAAYFGFLEICQPKSGETVLVNAAAGAVGSLVCQIAKIKGCTVIGFAGSKEKVDWLKELGIDFAFNYKEVDISQKLKDVAPKGIHCYFDNVGGEFTAAALPHMADFGRVAICGCISNYNKDVGIIGVPSLTSPFSEATILWKQLKVEGFIVTRWALRFNEAISQMKEWMDQGKIKYRETETVGFENVVKAFIGLFSGENIGKAVVKV